MVLLLEVSAALATGSEKPLSIEVAIFSWQDLDILSSWLWVILPFGH